MRLISIGDNKGRNAMVGIKSCKSAENIPQENLYSDYGTKRVIKSTLETDGKNLFFQSQDIFDLAEKICTSDPDIDFITEGMFAGKMHQVYLDSHNRITNDIHFDEEIYETDGTLREVRPFCKTENNIQNEDLPVRWSGLTVPLKEALRRYVFTRHYQLFHTNGLTFDFLYEMAKELEEKKVMVFTGSGPDGTDPIVLQKGGKKYRGFMSGRTSGKDKFFLFLHLTEIDLEDFKND